MCAAVSPHSPAYADLSFDFHGHKTHFSITKHANLDIVVFSSLGRIGQITEVLFPEPIIAQQLASHHTLEYETRLLLGSDDAPSDLLIRRLSHALVARFGRRRLLVCVGCDELSVEHIAAGMQQLEQQRQVLPMGVSRCLVARQIASSAALAAKEKTIFLPSTSFVNHVKSTERAVLDQQLAAAGRLDELYEWQRTNRKGESFELLDGPPYANGVPHVGHAINKLLKDFIVKSRILLGHRVRYRPGWDCHGLPIELKITKNVQGKTPLEIRELAREVANEAVGKQMHAFKRWGVSADWRNPYLTMSSGYVAEQLRAFGEMIDKGLVYRRFRPVYWSPSSQTALAESELEYNDKHKSTAAYMRFKMIDVSASDLCLPALSKPLVVYALAWTTTPWTLPLNNAICVAPASEYAVVQMETDKKNPVCEVYVMAAERVAPTLEAMGRKGEVLSRVAGSVLVGRHYRSCWHNELALPVCGGSHVTMDIGTGMVHTAYAHGMQDYQVAVERGDKVESFVDELGRYTRHMGAKLEGLPVQSAGQKEAMAILSKHILHSERITHSYPYDWRTKKPVILRSSAQWFIDVSGIAKEAAERVKAVPIGGGDSDQSGALLGQLSSRPAWCISRQRVWGTPIPALIDAEGNAHTNGVLASRVATLVESQGADVWWRCSVEEVATPEVLASLALDSADGLRKGTDIMDVWVDSGLAWRCARAGYEDADASRPADGVLEGVDQFRGWFQSMLLTAVAVKGMVPFSRIHVHGFTVDDKGKKMSKSIGNVVDPETITDGSLKQKALGADGLRLYVALYGAESAGESKIGPAVLEDVEKKMVSLRNSLRFLLGACDGYSGAPPPSPLPLLDQYILREAVAWSRRQLRLLRDYRFRAAANELVQFTQRPLSSAYVSLVRDRLYCNALGSPSHVAAQWTIQQIGSIMAHTMSPLLPHLATEFLSHQPGGKPEEVLRKDLGSLLDCVEQDVAWHPHLDELFVLVGRLRGRIGELAGPKQDVTKMAVSVTVSASEAALLLECSSQLSELLGVSVVRVEEGDESISLEPSPLLHCERCRKMTRPEGERHCARCADALLKRV